MPGISTSHFATEQAVAELQAMSAATIDRYLVPTRRSVQLRGTVAHCGPTLAGEFARTLTMTDLVTRWTENASRSRPLRAGIDGGVVDPFVTEIEFS